MQPSIVIKNARVHNLKSVSLELEPNQLICFTGVSGSGKSSLAFDTIYVEGQRRYVDSLSQHARRSLGQIRSADVDEISGITPTISIEQKSIGKNPRSTVGTMTEIYDFLRVLYARLSIPYCPVSQEPVKARNREEIIREIQHLPQGRKIILLAPLIRGKKGQFKDEFEEISRKGFTRVRVDSKIISLSDEISLEGHLSHDIDVVIDRVEIQSSQLDRLADSVVTALQVGNGVCIALDITTNQELLFSMHAYSPKSGISYPPLDPNDFSFNTPTGMCPNCQGLGSILEFAVEKTIDPSKSISEDCCHIANSYYNPRYQAIYEALADTFSFSTKTPWNKLSKKAQQVFLYGLSEPLQVRNPWGGSQSTYYEIDWSGIVQEAKRRYKDGRNFILRAKWHKYLEYVTCPECMGERIKSYPRSARFHGLRIAELTAMSIKDSLEFFKSLELTSVELKIGKEIVDEIINRLTFLNNVGLHYLSLSRGAHTLSGGESQRVRLASQIGSGLVGVTYILDEPSIGLHPRDNTKLIHTLQQLRDKGNTVIVVEHDEETMLAADEIVDVGPFPGDRGGKIVYQGDINGLIKCQESFTGAYLSGKQRIQAPKAKKPNPDYTLILKGASLNNLKKVELVIPLGCFVAVTGVSGSGKSSLIIETLFPLLSNQLSGTDLTVGPYQEIKGIEHIDKVIVIDQSPIGRTPRSNPATYIKLFDDIRNLFCQLPESVAKGYKPGRFSFNVQEGSCSHCNGLGAIKVDMDFLEEDWIECPLCQGKRFDQETLSVRFKGKNIRDILEMEVKEALEHFESIPSTKKKLETLSLVGLDYIKLGQWATTLSGGEAQRIKLAKELARPSTGKTIYILDEPTTGLHFHDIKHLLNVLHTLVDKGNTIVVIEHNMDLVKTADWVIDMGPEGGNEGGQIISAGTPQDISKLTTPTGIALHKILQQPTLVPCQAKKKARKKLTSPLCTFPLTIKGAEQHNLKKIDVTIPRGKITVCCGPSGSGKSSLAFDTIYAEGQRRYSDSLSAYARQFIKQLPKAKFSSIEGIPPAVALELAGHSANPRSTMGTMTEIYDYLRVLYSRLGIAYCPKTGARIQAISKEHVLEKMLSYPAGERVHILAPIEIRHQDKFTDVAARFQRQGFVRMRVNGTIYSLEDITQIPFDRRRKNDVQVVIDRFPIDPSLKSRIYEAIETASALSKGKLLVLRNDQEVFFNLSFSVAETGESYPEITPHTFAFNTAQGMCLDCHGIGSYWGLDIQNLGEFANMTPLQFCLFLWKIGTSSPLAKMLEQALASQGIELSCSLKSLTSKQLSYVLNGSEQWQNITVDDKTYRYRWSGINESLLKLSKYFSLNTLDEDSQSPLSILINQLQEVDCPSCKGSRLNPLARNVRLNEMTLPELCKLPIERALAYIKTVNVDKKENRALAEVLDQITHRLEFLIEIGIGYLSLERKAPTLSDGEEQRIRLARQLGSGLSGVLYVLDEPTTGLHPKDTQQLIRALDRLTHKGNTLLVVEHDPNLICHADHVLEFGPGSGKCGGEIIAQGSLDDILKNSNSLTRHYLHPQKKVLPPDTPQLADHSWIDIKNVSVRNLKNLSCSFPIGMITCITGVSGSGKSTLMNEVLSKGISYTLQNRTNDLNFTIQGHEELQHIVHIDRASSVITQRSDVATYLEILKHFREFFASLPQAVVKGLLPKNFSYYHSAGMCTACKGLGYKEVQLQFLPSVTFECEECRGKRLNPISLSVQYKDKSLADWLQLSVTEILEGFKSHPKISRLLQSLIDVGLGYLSLSQAMNTLSTGEFQRVNLCLELSKRQKDKTIYLIDEPTTGLHGSEIELLLKIFNDLRNKGATLVIIEHNLDVIAQADWIIDLGPEGGEKGGQVIATGTPAVIIQNKFSSTGKFLEEKFSLNKKRKDSKSKIDI